MSNDALTADSFHASFQPLGYNLRIMMAHHASAFSACRERARRIQSTFSDEFWLLPEVSNVPFEGTERVMAQLKRWRAGASFGVMENKLLSHSLLEALNVPQPAVLYGAFATKSLGAPHL